MPNVKGFNDVRKHAYMLRGSGTKIEIGRVLNPVASAWGSPVPEPLGYPAMVVFWLILSLMNPEQTHTLGSWG